ncbi:poly [ADP-ribose] polymerase tankyrase-like isoform X2 [Neocloeon triangulifer]|uniref:poly [ADP-ribose] polymerase tankyrase-like isoform X2 n=1 Tax=Neocloeon triangulifer TaxID=2078957 RepID=UPI00286F3980|nr:poly [ADP-ribose] polymerase tankyrase-like isoform X2 [Neocloeon triangulifer]XP_059474968.1 poly [ADP-ribose] polymerase tankyrase-like isoform X2 [Neocloeon triangulifer]XP_059474969.1 poly [ADP-ribose] polymerase tankyrase-like isoform X2 [Neocloeon triangulifer]XP_059474970.1 poly [ADP-ribose] polymerase tankyrase-like isoform X2 [Neocloeon triangulifer]
MMQPVAGSAGTSSTVKRKKQQKQKKVQKQVQKFGKPERRDWYVGFKLEELPRTHGDFKYIDEKMHSSIVAHDNHIKFSSYEILKVFKVLNSNMYECYQKRRAEMNQEIMKESKSSGYVEEMRLWHGSPQAEKICQIGFNLQPSNPNGMFGKGIYFAEHSSKSNQYSWGVNGGCPTHRDQSCYKCTRQMLLCKVALGRKYLTPQLITNAPPQIDTVVARPETINVGLRYPEYVIYNQDQAYPGYLVHYRILPEVCKDCTNTQPVMKAKQIQLATQPQPAPKVAIPAQASSALDGCTIC